MQPDSPDLLAFVQTLARTRGAEAGRDTPLFADRLLDSMNILHLIGFVEKRLGRRLREDELVMSNFKSVRAMEAAFFRAHGN